MESAQRFTPLSFWRVVWLLLKLRLMISISGFRRAKLIRKVGLILLLILILGFLGLIFFISWTILGFLDSPELAQSLGDLNRLLESVPVIMVNAAFLGILLTSFGVLLQALYLSGDMDFLLSTPVPLRAVFVTKLLQAILPNFGLICLFALPVMFGLAASHGYSLVYYPLLLILLACLALAAAGISSLLVMLIVRIFPARRVAEVLGFIGATISILCSQSGQIANWVEFSSDQTTQTLTLLERFNVPWSPLTWAGRGLTAIGEGSWGVGISYLGITLTLAIGIFLAALISSEKMYYSGWASLQSHTRKKKAIRKSRTRSQPELVSKLVKLIPSPIRAMVIKDWIVMRRDLRNMSQLITPLIVGIIYAVMFLRGGGEPPPGRGEAPPIFMDLMKNAMVYANVGISLFVGWMLLSRLAGIGFSQEGKNYWLLKSAPLSVGKLITSKFLVAYLPVLGLSWVFLVAIWLLQGASLSTLIFALPVVTLSIAGNAGVNLSFGILGANLNWEDPRQMQRGVSSCLGVIVSMVYLLISLMLFFGPPLAFGSMGLSEGWGQVAGLVLGGSFSLVCTILPPWLTRSRILLFGED